MDQYTTDILEQEQKAVEEMITIRPLTPQNAAFTGTEGGFLAMRYTGDDGVRQYNRVNLHRCFPFSDPEHDIAVCDPTDNNREIGLIHSLSDFSEDTVRLLMQQLELRYYHPIIKRVISVREEMGCTYWDTETDHGLCRFTVSMGGTHIYSIGGDRYMIEDLEGNRFEIPSLGKLTARERRLLDVFI